MSTRAIVGLVYGALSGAAMAAVGVAFVGFAFGLPLGRVLGMAFGTFLFLTGLWTLWSASVNLRAGPR